MIKRVLIVDDDLEMLLSLKDGLSRYSDTFSVSIAENGTAALNYLKTEPFSLVVTDLKMPGMDGFALLARIMEHFPDIPVIVMTGYSTAEMKRMALRGGAVGYIEKPFLIDELGRRILTLLRKESEGGTLHSVSSATFLQLIEMEEQTCTIRLTDKSTGEQGILFFRKGELIHARVGSKTGESAAHKIFFWDRVNLSIQNDCPQKKRTIHEKLQAVYLEAMRLKDEAEETPKEPEKPAGPSAAGPKARQKSGDGVDRVLDKLKKEAGEICGVSDIYRDGSWQTVVDQLNRIGRFFSAGSFKVGHIDRGEDNDFILFPGAETTVMRVNSRCPKDKILQVLGR